MKKLNIKRGFIPIENKEIILFQDNNNIILPVFFIDFMREYNGAKIHENCFDEEYVVSNILPLLKCQNASIELILPAVRNKEEGIGRDDLVPFAIDPGGRPFYFSLGKDDNGTVYIDRMGAGYENPLLKIADSFEEFINGLQAEE